MLYTDIWMEPWFSAYRREIPNGILVLITTEDKNLFVNESVPMQTTSKII